MSRSKEKTILSTQSFLPIDTVKDGIVITKDGRFIKILELSPSGFFMKKSPEKNAVIETFGKLLSVCPKNVQLKVITESADIREDVKELFNDISNEKNPKVLEIEKEFLNSLTGIRESSGISHRFFFIFEGEKLSSFQETKDAILYEEEKIKSIFYEMGNAVKKSPDKDTEVREILYTLLNRKRAGKVPFEINVYNVAKRYIDAGLKDTLNIPETDFFSPHAVSFSRVSRCEIDGRLFSYIYIDGKSYPKKVYGGFLGGETSISEGIDIDIFIRRENLTEAKTKVRKILQNSRLALSSMDESHMGFHDTSETLESAEYIEEEIRRGEKIFSVVTVFTVSGDTEEELAVKEKSLLEELSVKGIKGKKLYFEEEEGYLSTLPLARVHDIIRKKAERNVMTGGASSFYPYLSNEIKDKGGLVLGVSRLDMSIVSVNLFDRKKYTSGNVFIAGKTGSGKTFLLKTIATRARLKHIPVYILSLTKGSEFLRLTEELGGTYIRLGPGESAVIDICEITKKGNFDFKKSVLSEKVSDLLTFFSLLIPDIKREEKSLLEEKIIEVYEKFGITRDNSSVFYENGELKEIKTPKLSDITEELLKDTDTKRIGLISASLTRGTFNSFNGKTNVSLDSGFIVFDLTPVSEMSAVFGASVFSVLDFFMEKIKENAEENKLILFDEWWRFTENEVAAKYSVEIARTIRGYGGGVIFSTQQLSDAAHSAESEIIGKGIINACPTKFILGLEREEAEFVRKSLALGDTEFREILTEKPGEALLLSNGNTLPIKITVTGKEMEIFSDTEGKNEKERLTLNEIDIL